MRGLSANRSHVYDVKKTLFKLFAFFLIIFNNKPLEMV